MAKPFLLLSTRPENVEAERERADVVRFGGLRDDDVQQRRLDLAPLGGVDLDKYSGLIIAGGPLNVSDETRTPLQERIEDELYALTERCLRHDFPFLGLCYGMGVLAVAAGGRVDREFGEEASAPTLTVTDAGREDPLLAETPDSFQAFTGHKEAVSVLPPGATVLVTGEGAPNQLFRIGVNAYATQFHPELDAASFAARLRVYRDLGYAPPGEADRVAEWALSTDIGSAANDIIASFAARYQSR